MMKITVTGSSGFVGQNFLKYIASENILYNCYSLRNIQSSANLFNCDSVVHLAGKAHDIKKVSDPKEYYYVNFELTKNLYDVFLKSEATKFIFISSVKAAADSLTTPLTETYSPQPKTHYGKSKLMAEEYILTQPLPPGKSYFILRPCMIHGPGNKGNLNLLYNFVAAGFPYPFAAFDNKRSFLSIDNLCFVMKEILEREDITSGIYNIADDASLSTTEVVSLLSKALGKRPRLVEIPRPIIKAIAKAGDLLFLPLNTERLTKLTENYVVSNKKIKQVLKKELPLSAEEGILKTAFSFKNA